MRSLAIVWALVTVAWATTARAQASAPAISEPEAVVITGTRTPESSQRATIKTDVVTRAEAEARGATNVAEALTTQPGVRVDPGAYGNIGGASAIQIQGFDLQRVLILEDGEPIVGDIGGAIDLSAIPIGDVERIEIVTGPTSALYGSSAIGGVVNILTAPPRAAGLSGRVRAEARSYLGLLGQGNLAYRRDRAWVSLDASGFRQDGIAPTPGVPDLQIPETVRSLLGVRAGAPVAKGVETMVRARWLRDRSDGLSSELVPVLGRFLTDLPAQTDRYTLHLIENIDLGAGSRLRVTAGSQWIDNTTAQIQRGSQVGERHARKHRMQSLEAVNTIADGARTWVFGGRAELEHFTQNITKTESTNAGLQSMAADEVSPATLGRAALYGHLQWKLGDMFAILPGIRAETHTRYGGAVTPRLALSFWPVEQLQLRASMGRGFRAPSAKELGFQFDHSSLGYRVLGNPDLRPETSWGVNGDVTWRPSSVYTLRAGTFVNWVRELIDVDLAGGSADGAVVDYRYRNYGKARTFGVQLSATARLDTRFSADFAYDYLWTRDDVNDQPLGGRPPHTFSAGLRAVTFWKLEASARWRASTDAYVSRMQRSAAYETIDLRLSRELWPRSQGFIGVLNVSDVHQQAGRVGDFRPPLGRTFYVGVRADFPQEEP